MVYFHFNQIQVLVFHILFQRYFFKISLTIVNLYYICLIVFFFWGLQFLQRQRTPVTCFQLRLFAILWKIKKKILTNAQCQVEKPQTYVQSEEQNHIGHFTKENDVAQVLLDGNWGAKMKQKQHILILRCFVIWKCILKGVELNSRAGGGRKTVTETLNDKENWFNNKHNDNRHWEHKDSQVPKCLVYKQNLHTRPLHNDHDDVKRLFGDVWMSVENELHKDVLRGRDSYLLFGSSSWL